MISSIYSMGVNGILGSGVTVECYITNGLPSFEIVGLPDAAVKEARERVRAAAKTSGMRFPAGRITINLAPAGMKKAGTHYDLPILLSILSAYNLIRRPSADSAFIGELSLDGKIRPVPGVLPMAMAAKREGFEKVYVPAENAKEATLARGPAIIPVHQLLPNVIGNSLVVDNVYVGSPLLCRVKSSLIDTCNIGERAYNCVVNSHHNKKSYDHGQATATHGNAFFIVKLLQFIKCSYTK